MIRVAGYPDFSHMSRIHISNFVRGWKTEEIRELMEKPGTKGFVDDRDGIRAGFAIIRMVEDECEIISIAVSKTSLRQGVGGKLLEFLEKYVKREGLKTLFLEVAEDNDAARALYHKAGFEEFGKRKDYYVRWHGRGVDAIMMRKSL